MVRRTPVSAMFIALMLAVAAFCRPDIAGAATPSTGSGTQTCVEQPGGLPDPSCTPGALNPAVTPATVDTTICVAGYSGSVRPPSSYTSKLKVKQMTEYRRSGSPSDYEEDHMINLSLGGSPKSPKNLWPQARAGTPGETAGDKDVVEFKLYRAVCDHKIGLREAQRAIVADWTTAVAQLGL